MAESLAQPFLFELLSPYKIFITLHCFLHFLLILKFIYFVQSDT